MGKEIIIRQSTGTVHPAYDVYRREGGYRRLKSTCMTTGAGRRRSEEKWSARPRWCGISYRHEMEFLAKPGRRPVTLGLNADESEPGTFKDRYLMESIPTC